jgi:hypothetical protein
VSRSYLEALTGLAGAPDAQVRFHYTAAWAYCWQIDDVLVSTRILTPTPGGLVVGTVKDGSTGAGLVGATVTGRSNPSVSTVTIATPKGPRSVTASSPCSPRIWAGRASARASPATAFIRGGLM